MYQRRISQVRLRKGVEGEVGDDVGPKHQTSWVPEYAFVSDWRGKVCVCADIDFQFMRAHDREHAPHLCVGLAMTLESEVVLADIPLPRVLDPRRVATDDREQMTTDDHRARWKRLAGELSDTCAYAEQLHNALVKVWRYLYESLPPSPNEATGEAEVRLGATPRGPDDEAGWSGWQDAFAGVTSVLCGPNGDSGFGRENATVVARSRQSRIPATDLPEPAALDSRSEPPDLPDPVDTASDPADQTDRPPGLLRSLGEPLAYVTVGALAAIAAMRGRRR